MTAIVVVKITSNQWDLLGLDDHRVAADYAEKGVTLDRARGTASGDADALDTLRHHAGCFENAESAGTRRSMAALVRAIDRVAPCGEG